MAFKKMAFKNRYKMSDPAFYHLYPPDVAQRETATASAADFIKLFIKEIPCEIGPENFATIV